VRDAITVILMAVGALFVFVAGIGVLRLPDLYMRMSATTKAATLGVGCLVAAAAVHFDDLAIASRAAMVVLFLLSTAPIAAHMIGRAAYFAGVPLWPRTVRDELRERGERGAQTTPDPDHPADGPGPE
jgi:multicomponent Na+:H+ antiporter subunit G